MNKLKKTLTTFAVIFLCQSCLFEGLLNENLGLATEGQESSLCSANSIASPTFLPIQGDGTATTPYIICNVFQLQLMGNVDFEGNVNILTNNASLDGYFELGTNINALATTGWTGGPNGNGFIPIGALDTDYYGISVTSGFAGSFNGNGFTISGLYMNRTRGTVGMFGSIAPFAVVTNLNLTGINITQNDTGSGQFTGGLAGRLFSTIEDIYVQGSISGDRDTGGVIGNAYLAHFNRVASNTLVNGAGINVGGLVGNASYTDFDDSQSMGNTIGASLNTGGFAGNLLETIVNHSFSSGNVQGVSRVGGFVGSTEFVIISFSHSSGDVIGDDRVGGFEGNSSEALIRDSYTSSNVTGSTRVGGFTGDANEGTIENSFASGDVIGDDSGNMVAAFAGTASSQDIFNSFAIGQVQNNNVTNIAYGIVGVQDGSPDIQNVYWFNAGGNATQCEFTGVQDCNTLGAPSAISDFYSSTHVVYAGSTPPWDFTSVWQEQPGALPTLRAP